MKEAGELLNKKELADLGQRYYQIGQKWTAIAKLIRETPKNMTNLHEARKMLLKVANEETKVLSSLARIFE